VNWNAIAKTTTTTTATSSDEIVAAAAAAAADVVLLLLLLLLEAHPRPRLCPQSAHSASVVRVVGRRSSTFLFFLLVVVFVIPLPKKFSAKDEGSLRGRGGARTKTKKVDEWQQVAAN
jgi:hypothetical protein